MESSCGLIPAGLQGGNVPPGRNSPTDGIPKYVRGYRRNKGWSPEARRRLTMGQSKVLPVRGTLLTGKTSGFNGIQQAHR